MKQEKNIGNKMAGTRKDYGPSDEALDFFDNLLTPDPLKLPEFPAKTGVPSVG